MTETEHSPLPWRILDDTYGCAIIDANRSFVADTQDATPESAPNAALIVERVNGWDALVRERDELRAFVASIGSNWDCDTGAGGEHASYCRRCDAKALLAKVRP